MEIVKSKAPTRIDLAGGTLDIWPLHHLISHKCTVNIAINLYANVEISESSDKYYHINSVDQNEKFKASFEDLVKEQGSNLIAAILTSLWRADLPPLDIKMKAESPKGAGLGGSSTLGIALAGALNYMRHMFTAADELSHRDLAHLVANAEAKILKIPTGTQDHWAALRGGLNVIEYPLEGEKVETFAPDLFESFWKSATLCYSGESRVSGKTNWEFYKQAIDGEQAALGFLEAIGSAAEACGKAVRKKDYASFVASSTQEWEERKKFFPNCETERTSFLENLARQAGATFSRLCGAGGGGAMLILSPPSRKQEIRRILEMNGASVLDVESVEKGLDIWEEK